MWVRADPLPRAKFQHLLGQKKLAKFGILATNLPLKGDSFAQFLRNYQRLHMSISSF